MADDVKYETCKVKKVYNSTMIGNLILPNSSIIRNIFGSNGPNGIPVMDAKEIELVKDTLKDLNIFDLIINSISNQENISSFADKLSLDNWEGVFYIVLLHSFGFTIPNSPIQNRNYDFFSRLIESNPYMHKPADIDTKTAEENRYILSLIYKEKLSSEKPILNRDVVREICEFLPRYKLRDWIDEEKIDWNGLYSNPSPGAIELIKEELEINPYNRKYWRKLSGNPGAIEIIEKELKENPNSERIRWSKLSQNPGAIEIIEKELKENPNSDRINWFGLSINPGAIEIIEKELKRDQINNRIVWSELSQNPSAIEIIKEELKRDPNSDRINWFGLSLNPSAIDILKEELKRDPINNRIEWDRLSQNPSAIELLKEELKEHPNDNRINWIDLSQNPSAIELLMAEYERNPNSDRLYWFWLSGNPGAIELIKEELKRDPNSERINWTMLSTNSSIFEPIYNIKLQELLMQLSYE